MLLTIRASLGEIFGMTELDTWKMCRLPPLTQSFLCTTGMSCSKIKKEADLGSNIDRLLAIYQTLYPSNWFLPSDDPPSNASLKPFYHSFPGDLVPNTRLFTSDDVHDWTIFGYQYDVLQRQSGESQDQYIARINTWVKSEYGGTAALLLNDSKRLFRNIDIKDHTYHDYIIDVIYDRFDVLPYHRS